MPCYELDSAPGGYDGSTYSTLQDCDDDCEGCGSAVGLVCQQHYPAESDIPAYYAWLGGCNILSSCPDDETCVPVGTIPGYITGTFAGTLSHGEFSYFCNANTDGVVADWSVRCECYAPPLW